MYFRIFLFHQWGLCPLLKVIVNFKSNVKEIKEWLELVVKLFKVRIVSSRLAEECFSLIELSHFIKSLFQVRIELESILGELINGSQVIELLDLGKVLLVEFDALHEVFLLLIELS